MNRLRHRGIILVMTLLVSIIVAMMLGASLALSPGRLAQTGSNVDQAQAEAAIEAGVDYARARLQEDPTWKGNLNKVVVNTPTLYIKEDNGNVVGLLRPDESSPFSQFRIRFNFYNGAPTIDPLDDGLGDPSTDMQFDLGMVSVNNLEGGVRFVPQVSTISDAVDTASLETGLFQIGPGTVALSVEGMGGAGLSDTGPNNFEPKQGQRNVARRTAEIILASEFSDQAPNAALMSGGDLHFELPINSGRVQVTSKRGFPRTRSKGDVTATNGQFPFNYGSKGELAFKGAEDVRENGSTILVSEANEPFYELAWDEIHKASIDPTSSNPKPIKIPGGTYVFDDDGTLHYYEKTWAQYKTDEAARIANNGAFDAGLVVTARMANLRSDSLANHRDELVGLSSFSLAFKDDVLVTPSTNSNVTDFTLVPMRGTQAESQDLQGDVINIPPSTDPNAPPPAYAKNIELKLVPGKKGKAALTTSGDMLIAAKLSSSKGASLVSEGDLRVDAGKLAEFGKVGLSFYSKKSMQISTYDRSNSTYGPVGVDGMFYAWNNFTIQTGEPGLPTTAWKPISVEGALVAYGTNNGPELEPPGTAPANMTLTCSEADITWDPRKLGDLLNISKYSSKTTLTRVSYARH